MGGATAATELIHRRDDVAAEPVHDDPMCSATPSIQVRDGDPAIVVALAGQLSAEVEAELEAVMSEMRRSPRNVIFDVSCVEHLDVTGVLLLADHAQWLRRRSCTVSLEGAEPAAEQLARLLGYERVFGLG
jgi:anti-anti-sigma factor